MKFRLFSCEIRMGWAICKIKCYITFCRSEACMKSFALYGVLAFVAVGLAACGDDGSSAASQDDDGAVVVEEYSSSSAGVASSAAVILSSSQDQQPESSAEVFLSSSQDQLLSSSAVAFAGDTTKIAYTLKPFEGPLANPHKGFTVPTGGTWVFVPEFEYGPYGSLGNKAWDLVTYGSGYQRWDELNPGKGVYDWSKLENLLNLSMIIMMIIWKLIKL